MTGTQRGRTLITEKALKNLVVGVASTVLRVSPGRVKVTISDHNGLLALEVRGPVGLTKHDENLLEQAETARQRLCQIVTTLSGRQIGDCLLELDGIQRTKQGRVQ